MAKVDVFSPFQKRSEDHEDRLTWGFMVALKYSSELQRFLRDLVLQRLPAGRWPTRGDWDPAVVSTQTARLGMDASFVVSVLLSDDSLAAPVEVQRADRTARYDGVVEYPDGLVLIIENKPRRSAVRAEQLSPSLDSLDAAGEVELFEHAISLEWAEVLEGVLNYATSPVTAYPARSLAADFLAFVEDLHPTLSPYRTFELCGRRREALDRRIEGLLQSIGSGLGYEVGTRPGDKPYLDLPNEVVRQVHLTVHRDPEDKGLILQESIWPGDTVSQARAFLHRVDRDAFIRLDAGQWEIQPNLHYSHIQKHLIWADTSLSISEYLDYFTANQGEIGKKSIAEVELADLIAEWRGVGLISASDEEDLWREFGETQRSSINVVSGFRVTREWSMASVIELEAENQLEKVLIDALRVPLATWGETIPQWAAE